MQLLTREHLPAQLRARAVAGTGARSCTGSSPSNNCPEKASPAKEHREDHQRPFPPAQRKSLVMETDASAADPTPRGCCSEVLPGDSSLHHPFPATLPRPEAAACPLAGGSPVSSAAKALSLTSAQDRVFPWGRKSSCGKCAFLDASPFLTQHQQRC